MKCLEDVSGTAICFVIKPEVGDSSDNLYQKTAEVGKSPLNSCAVGPSSISGPRPSKELREVVRTAEFWISLLEGADGGCKPVGVKDVATSASWS